MGTQVWDGGMLGDAAAERHTLADRAKRYEWDAVLALLAEHPDLVNAARPGGGSWYALHQAAHGGAPVEVVEQLVDLGAWRLLPTATGERPFEIARRRGHAHLLESLQPRPVIDVPAGELLEIQRHFHEVIRGRVAELIDRNGLRLPVLAVLTEREPPDAYFPVPGMYGGFHLSTFPRRVGLAADLGELVTDSRRVGPASRDRRRRRPADG